jgi:hypothetical protein
VFLVTEGITAGGISDGLPLGQDPVSKLSTIL